MAKVIISIIIVLSASFIGYILAYKYVQRPRQIKHLLLTLQLLETEILYLLTPLPLALKKVAGKSPGELNRIFSETSMLLEKKNGFSIEDAWRQSVEKNYPFTSLTMEDKEVLVDFGMSLGTVDRDHQMKNFHYIYAQLKKQLQSAEDLRLKNERMYKSLGILLGMTIVILFL